MPGSPTTLGLDIGGTSTKLVVRAPDGVVTRRSSRAYSRPSLAELGESIRATLGPSETRSPVAVGCCVPGKFAPDGLSVAYSANLPCLNGVHIPGFVHTLFSTPPNRVRVLPDALATALGSWARDPVPGRLLAVSLGTGVGCSLLEAGRPVLIGPGTSGHLGQIDVSLSPDAPIGPDGGRGSLEAYIGLPALRARFGESVAEGIATMPADDPALLALARAIRIAHAIYTPDAVRLLGGIGIALTPRLETLRSLVARDLTGVAHPGWTLNAEDDPYLAAMGAALEASRESESSGPSSG